MIEYTPTPDFYNDYICHKGVKGMKWRYHKRTGLDPNTAYGRLQKRNDIESLVDKAKLVGKKGSSKSSTKGTKEKTGSSKAAKETKEKKEKEEKKTTEKETATKSVSKQQLENAKAALAKANTSKLDQIRESLKLTSPRKTKFDEIKETQEKIKRTKKK